MSDNIKTERKNWMIPLVVGLAWLIGTAYCVVFPPGADAVVVEPDTPAVICESDCNAEDWANARTQQFRNDQLGNMGGLHFRDGFQKWVNKKMEAAGYAKPVAQKGITDWWRDNISVGVCIISNPVGVHQGICRRGQEAVNRTTANTIRLVVTCGGAGIIGKLDNGGEWGAGKAAAGCLFVTIANKLLP